MGTRSVEGTDILLYQQMRSLASYIQNPDAPLEHVGNVVIGLMRHVESLFKRSVYRVADGVKLNVGTEKALDFGETKILLHVEPV